MDRRTYIKLTSGLVTTTMLAGCSGEPESDGGSDSDGNSGGGSEDETDSSDSEQSSSSDDSSGDDSGSDDSGDSEESSSDDSGGDSDSEDSSSDESDSESDSGTTLEAKVIYDGEWSGAVGTVESTRSVDGSGEETFEIDVNPDDIVSVSINAQKQDDSGDELVVQILENGEVVAESSTTAEYGVASTSYSNF